MQFGHALAATSACPELVNEALHSIRQDVVVRIVVVGEPVFDTTQWKDERERQRSREGCIPTLESGETAELREIGTSNGETFRPPFRLFSFLFAAHILFMKMLFHTLPRWVGLVGERAR
jgi:hypothetical protein